MNEKPLIPTQTLCLHYNIEISFLDALSKIGLIQVVVIEQKQFIYEEKISDLEKIIRLYNELNLNLEGIDVVFNLLDKERKLQNELIALKNRLRLYENIE